LTVPCGRTWPAWCTCKRTDRNIAAIDAIHWPCKGKWWNCQKSDKFSFETCRIVHTEWWRLFWNTISI